MTSEEALEKAKNLEVDLVEVAPNAKPPVCKLIDFKKFKYEESKKQRLAKKLTKETETKELWMGPLMSEHDFNIHIKRAIEFLTAGNRVKLNVRFSGREMAHPEFGHQIIEKAKEALENIGSLDKGPVFLGRNLIASFNPKVLKK